ncbi:hypothetical protein BGZ83_006157 [Gryganskiella cystojenkinii]|nr:hypothetical protein BGZ83_006157 [Gryganskiella cystojenkinii]
MASNKPDNSNVPTDPASGAQGAHNGVPGSSGRSIFSVTMDPNALEQELDQAAHALHSSVNSLLNTMQATVFGGLETLSREMATLERNSKDYLEQSLQEGQQHVGHHMFPWSLRNDGPKKRYRITIEELPPLEEGDKKGGVFTTSRPGKDQELQQKDPQEEEFTITQGKAGTADEGKTVITTSVSPGLLDWLLFTTHEDSFFRRLGQKKETEGYDVIGGTSTKITELKDGEDAHEQDAAKKRIVPALVEKVKKVGTTWEKDARHWWQRKAEEHREASADDHQHHLFSGTSQSERDQEEERQARHWPRGRSWGRSETFSQTTVTRPDGTVEHRTVNSLNGDTETIVKIQHPDGSVEETVTRENNQWGQGHGHGQGRRGWGISERNEEDQDQVRDEVTAVIAEAFADELKAADAKEQETQQQHKASKSWPPKAWVRRHENE